MALGSTQPLTEMSTRNLPGGKKRPAIRADNLAAIYEPNVWKLWEPEPLRSLKAFMAYSGIASLPEETYNSVAVMINDYTMESNWKNVNIFVSNLNWYYHNRIK
jgi:hypothetical protein